jgi:hypothetical protein
MVTMALVIDGCWWFFIVIHDYSKGGLTNNAVGFTKLREIYSKYHRIYWDIFIWQWVFYHKIFFVVVKLQRSYFSTKGDCHTPIHRDLDSDDGMELS